MPHTIKVRVLGQKEIREVTLAEARQILEKAASDPLGGLVTDGQTGQAIWQIGPETEEIVIIEQMIGGG